MNEASCVADTVAIPALCRIDLHPLGGLSGDMFLAAAIDAYPSMLPAIETAVRAVGLPADWQIRVTPHNDGSLTGRQVQITPAHAEAAAKPEPTGRFAAIRARIQAAPLAAEIQHWAITIFTRLAEAEATVHGQAVDDVHFHEIADWDSVADIVGAATVIATLNVPDWRLQPLPLGQGQITTRHGILSVPAPATTLLLRGLPVRDDGISGERVTPTGAAIARALFEQNQDALTPDHQSVMQVAATGTGFGSRRLGGISNCLRLLSYANVCKEDSPAAEPIVRLGFEIDDQSPEDLALATAHLRALPAVLDVSQWSGTGKKGRMTIALRVLVEAGSEDAVIAACFQQTSTLGVRIERMERRILPRQQKTATADGQTFRIKTGQLPGGQQRAKIEADDLAQGDYLQRRQWRHRLEQDTE